MTKLVKVHVQGLNYAGRLACYELLLELLQVSWECGGLNGLYGVSHTGLQCSAAMLLGLLYSAQGIAPHMLLQEPFAAPCAAVTCCSAAC